MPKLVVVIRPGAEPQELRLGRSSITMGREPENELQLDGLEVSRRHCRIEPLPSGQGYRVVDLNSKNGTFLNGLQVTAMALDYDDQLRVGDSLLIYVPEDTTIAQALRGIDQGTAWLPATNDDEETSGLLEPSSEEENSTWRSSVSVPEARGRAGMRGPHTRSSNRSYLKERLLRLGLLTQNIASAPDLSRLMDTILDEVLDFTGFERGLLLLTDEEGRATRLQPVRGRYMDHEHLDDHERNFSRGLVEEALRERRITFRSGLATTDSSFSMRESVISMGLESALCIPLHTPRRFAARGETNERRRAKRRSRVLGAIYLDSTNDIRPLDKPDLKLLEAVAAQAAIALQNARLHHQASTDPLTGLHNRNFLRQLFDDELRQAQENGEGIGVLLLDLDHFKKINDTHGHDVGDEVLKRVSQRIRRTIRRDDYAARWGGEEFLILLPNSDSKGTEIVANKVRVAIREQPIGEVGITVTTSVGMACYPGDGDTMALLIKRADQALYEAKRTGRDKVVVFVDDLDRTGFRNNQFESLFDDDSANTQRNLKALFDTIDLLRKDLEPQEVLKRCLDQVVDLTRARRALLLVPDDDDDLAISVARGRGGRTLKRGVREFSKSTARRAMEERRSICSLSADEERLTSSSIDRLGLNTVMCVPVVVSNDVFGALYADDTVANREFGQRDLAHLEMIAHQLGLSLAANFALFQAASGSRVDPHQDETARLRDEVSRLRAEITTMRQNTRKFKRGEFGGVPREVDG